MEDAPGEILNVVPGFGPYKNIQDAVNAANPGSSIVVAPGLYTRSIKITKPNLVLEAREINGEVQLSVSSGPLISISLQENQKCVIRGFKFIHSGDKNDGGEEDDNIENLQIRSSMNCALYVKGGEVTAEDCMVTLGSVKSPMASFVVSEGHLIMNQCEIKGNSEVGTVGVYCKESSLTMQYCKIYKHKSGGVILKNTVENVVNIEECNIFRNGTCGILCDNFEAAPCINANKIMQNEGAGIKVIEGNMAIIKENEVKYNEVGIWVKDSSPQLSKNRIRCNFGDGVILEAADNHSEPKLSGNQIYENENGIKCIGTMCNPIIENNTFIGNNRKAGIRLQDDSHAEIQRNEIFENVCQGILLVTGCDANIEDNQIYGNLRANIALGAGSTQILRNNIYKGRCEGIFVMDGTGCIVSQNSIHDNNDGILTVDTTLEITNNTIYDNKRTGITVAGKGNCTITQNEIYRNSAVGINVRDEMDVDISGMNKSYDNMIQITYLSKTNIDVNELQRNNEFTGEVQLPLANPCCLL